MERFLDLSVDLMAISDLSTEILVASRSFSRMGWDVDAVVGQRVLDLIHPDDLPRALDELARILDGGEAVRVTLRLRGGDGGYRWVQGNAIADLERERIYFTAADITERKALEDELLSARRELERRNADLERSNEELERFAYAAAHDLKAPLARIEMALAASPGAPGSGTDLLDIARRAASRMSQLIEDLLSYAAVSLGTESSATEVDLDSLLTEVLSDLGPAIEAGGIQVQREPLPSIVGHEVLLGQLLQNLIGNSAKFTRDGVLPELRIGADLDDCGVTLHIIDNGIGIDPDQREAVFGVFTRLHSDDRYAGSGIGLATCAKVVAHHGGRIWADDGIDGGTAIHVWLPAIS